MQLYCYELCCSDMHLVHNMIVPAVITATHRIDLVGHCSVCCLASGLDSLPFLVDILVDVSEYLLARVFYVLKPTPDAASVSVPQILNDCIRIKVVNLTHDQYIKKRFNTERPVTRAATCFHSFGEYEPSFMERK